MTVMASSSEEDALASATALVDASRTHRSFGGDEAWSAVAAAFTAALAKLRDLTIRRKASAACAALHTACLAALEADSAVVSSPAIDAGRVGPSLGVQLVRFLASDAAYASVALEQGKGMAVTWAVPC